MMNLKTLFASLYLLFTCLTSVHSVNVLRTSVTFPEFPDGACLSSIRKPVADEIGSSPTLKGCLEGPDGASTWDIKPTFQNGHIGTDGLCLNTSMVFDLCSNDPNDDRQLFSYLKDPGPFIFAPPGSSQGQVKCLAVVDSSTVGADACDNTENQLFAIVDRG